MRSGGGSLRLVLAGRLLGVSGGGVVFTEWGCDEGGRR